MRNIPGWYRLEGHTPVPCDLFQANTALQDAETRRVARTDIPGGYVSTVFLGLDHTHGFTGPPMLFETMVMPNDGEDVAANPNVESANSTSVSFWETWEYECQRYSTWDEAERGHEEMVARVRQALSKSSD